MNQNNKKNVGKFYCNFKLHKPHQEMKAPLEGPVVSGCRSITENVMKSL